MLPPFIQKIEIRNYRSFVEAGCRLRPFTLVVGANNSGKSNFLRLFEDISSSRTGLSLFAADVAHQSHRESPSSVRAGHSRHAGDNTWSVGADRTRARSSQQWEIQGPLPIYKLDPDQISAPERDEERQMVLSTGEGTTRVLNWLKTGIHEERFNAIERAFCRCVPEVSKLSFYRVEGTKRAIQVTEAGLPEPVPLSQLSDGSRIILAILTIIHQPEPPEVILLEDIDHGIHPRLYEDVVRQMRAITQERGVQIIATTHSPYLVDEFKDEPEAVVIVEKVNGESRLANMDERLRVFLAEGESLAGPLGQAWFTGLTGGVPRFKLPSLPRKSQS